MIATLIQGAIAAGGALLSYFGQQQALDAQKTANAESLAASRQAMQDQLALSREQYNQQRSDLSGYREQGGQGLNALSTLLGANGADEQALALADFQNDPTLQALITGGERSVLKGASATGQLRSGSAQSALAGVSPSIIQNALNDRIGQLSGLAGLGLNAANMTGQAGQNMQRYSDAAMSGYGANASAIAQSNGQLNSVNPLLNSLGYGLGYLGSPQGGGLLTGLETMFAQQPSPQGRPYLLDGYTPGGQNPGYGSQRGPMFMRRGSGT